MDLQVARVVARVSERGVAVTLTDSARQTIADMGYDPVYGARPLRRVIQKQLTDRLALALLEGELREGDSVVVDAVGGSWRWRRAGQPRRRPHEPSRYPGLYGLAPWRRATALTPPHLTVS